MGNGTGAYLGHAYGMDKPELAAQYIKASFLVGMLFWLVYGSIVILAHEGIFRLYFARASPALIEEFKHIVFLLFGFAIPTKTVVFF